MNPSPNKALGQHWLDDITALEHICNMAELTTADTVLEIGPGPGALTKQLTARAGRVVAVEFDPQLAKQLPQRVKAANLEVVHGDILSYDLSRLPKNYKVVANVPYYITSKIVQVLLTATNRPSRIVLLVQKEVAERLAAAPGDMSILAVSAQLYAEVSLGAVVPAIAFTPPPKVDSQVVILQTRSAPLFPHIPDKHFFKVVKAGFSAKRKKLRSSLSGGLQLPKPTIETLVRAANINPDARAEALTLDDWARLTQEVINLETINAT
ncbi:MAG TPA: 16S rRNA (adenine(1518)-N(6)/adenine(1519)-N(6))-dimethyltransferase RsmA [Verrucomicrobiae bacterium]|nr:16S rRNA (adenine(1518)-N(6)/adenine(1519)-N(6))-dimethyltransferase RsmA [Verrucomicrobiae bacterium]